MSSVSLLEDEELPELLSACYFLPLDFFARFFGFLMGFFFSLGFLSSLELELLLFLSEEESDEEDDDEEEEEDEEERSFFLDSFFFLDPLILPNSVSL